LIAGISHLMLEQMHLVLNRLQSSERSKGRFMYSRARLEVNVLRQQPKIYAPGTDDIATIRRFFTGYKAKDSSLARTISADKPNVFARIDLERGSTQDILRTVGFVNVGKPKKHGSQ
jgi:hypothetical protein